MIESFLSGYGKEIFTFGSALFIWALTAYARPKARLVYGVRQHSSVLIDDIMPDHQGQAIPAKKLVRTIQFQFTNTGREPATDTQVTLNWRPQHFNIWPNRHFETKTAGDGRFTLLVGTLPPKGFIAIELLSVAEELPDITSAFCNECTARPITMIPQEVHPSWLKVAVLYLMIMGGMASIYGLLTAIEWAVK